jgi:hypothetical protein
MRAAAVFRFLDARLLALARSCVNLGLRLVDSLLLRRRQFLGLRILHDFGKIFCAKEKLLPIESKLSRFPIFAGVCTFRRRKKASHRGPLRMSRGHYGSQHY